jgi:DNA-binding NtrC family response regulator
VETGEFRRDLYHRLNVLRIAMPPLRERRADIPRLIHKFVDEFSAQHDRSFLGIEPETMRILVEYAWPGNVRELRNLVESMVVLAPGRTVRPEDVPPEVRFGGGRGSLLPVVLPRAGPPDQTGSEDGARPAELDYVLRTLFDLRLDVEDLRREFELYRSRREREPAEISTIRIPGESPYFAVSRSLPPSPIPEAEPEQMSNSDAVVYRHGMTMEELERNAIEIALQHSDGNRRKAAEALGIGERTLYRKLKEYQIES